MAKIVNGGRTYKDPEKRYGVYKHPSRGTLIRRAMHPEYYLHSWNWKVRRNREIFATAMEYYGSLDIYTKQAYTETIMIKPVVPIPPINRKKLDDITKKIKRKPPGGPGYVPPHVPQPWLPPDILPTPNPNIDINPHIDPANWPNPKQGGVPGHKKAIDDEYARRDWRDPSRSPFPGDIPDNERDISKDRSINRNPVMLVIEIEPTGISGAAYKAYLWAKSEYQTVKRFISAHKKEVIIILIVGAVITFGYTLIFGGGLEVSGTYILANEGIKGTPLALSLLSLPYPIEWIRDYWYKKLVIGWATDLDFSAWNDSRGWWCYKEVEVADTLVNIKFYQGPSKTNKGNLAAGVLLKVDPETQTANIQPYCGNTKDRIVIYYKTAPIHKCNIGEEPYDIVSLYNLTQGQWGESKTEWDGRQLVYRFEDRPVWGDGDYNDAYAILTYDENWNLISVEAIEGEHYDELILYWRGYIIGWFPRRC